MANEKDIEARQRRRASVRKWNRSNIERIKAHQANPKNRAVDAIRTKAYRKNHPLEVMARTTVTEAIKYGVLTRAMTCDMCGKMCRTQAHHDSYMRLRWLVVTWLCSRCHHWIHRQWRYQAEGIWL